MRAFIDEDFLLGTEMAKTLYHSYAAAMPILDYHCHINPQEIAENRQYDTITQLWLEGDHYKWRMMRWCGVPERYITGDATDREKFDAFAACLPRAIGNPLYHWTHLELRRYFGCELALCPDTAEEIWVLCNKKLQSGFAVRDIIRLSNVEALCTTDDPVDTLEWHRQIAADEKFSVGVFPTFRQDRALQVDKPGFPAYVKMLEAACGYPIACFETMCAALSERLAFFVAMGCRVSDHGLPSIPWNPDGALAEQAFQNALQGVCIPERGVEAYQTELLLYLGKQYAKNNLAMQVHYGVQRNSNPSMFQKLGPDAGFDCIDTPNCSRQLAAYLGALQKENLLPKTILYSLNPSDNALLACMAGAFQDESIPGKVQQGSAWWFNDTKQGMSRQLTTLADMGVLGSFVGMLTDSRSFLSYTRHEYFRRIVCGIIGKWVEEGEYPRDEATLGSLVQDISYHNCKRYFGF